jgi:hypothetical protein
LPSPALSLFWNSMPLEELLPGPDGGGWCPHAFHPGFESCRHHRRNPCAFESLLFDKFIRDSLKRNSVDKVVGRVSRRDSSLRLSEYILPAAGSPSFSSLSL